MANRAHAALRIAASTLMRVDESLQSAMPDLKALKRSPVALDLYVSDVDGTVARAVVAATNLTLPVADRFCGDRHGVLEDPFGHYGSVATRARDLAVDEIRKAGEPDESPPTPGGWEAAPSTVRPGAFGALGAGEPACERLGGRLGLFSWRHHLPARSPW